MKKRRARLAQCPDCGGAGAIAFERGPAVEACPRCRGSGRVYGDESLRGLFAAMIADRGVLLDPDLRLLLEGLDALEQRVVQLESELARLL